MPRGRTAFTVFMKFKFSRTTQHYPIQLPVGGLNPLSLFGCLINSQLILLCFSLYCYYSILKSLYCSHKQFILSQSFMSLSLQDYTTLIFLSLTIDSHLHSEVAQSCPTLCNPMDCSLPGSSIHGIFQAKILEWVAISA